MFLTGNPKQIRKDQIIVSTLNNLQYRNLLKVWIYFFFQHKFMYFEILTPLDTKTIAPPPLPQYHKIFSRWTFFFFLLVNLFRNTITIIKNYLFSQNLLSPRIFHRDLSLRKNPEFRYDDFNFNYFGNYNTTNRINVYGIHSMQIRWILSISLENSN